MKGWLFFWLLTVCITACVQGGSMNNVPSATEYFKDANSLALLDAAFKGDLTRAKQLVSSGVNPNDVGQRTHSDSLCLLHYAIAKESVTAIKTLLMVGANPECDTRNRLSAIAWSIDLDTNGHFELFKLLLSAKPLAQLSNNTRWEIATQFMDNANWQQGLSLYFEQGGVVDTTDSAEVTLFMQAMASEDYDKAEWLLTRGASLVFQSAIGRTNPNTVQNHLSKYKPNTPSYNQLLRMKTFMEQKGVVFPVPNPKQLRGEE